MSPPLFFSLKNHPIFNVTLFLWTTLLNGSRHRPNAEPRRAAVLCRRRYVLLNRIMQNSQFWGKNDALPSFALYFTVTTFWNVLELNKKKGIRTAADTDQSGFSFCNEFALEFLAVIGYKFFSSLPNINLLVSSYKVFIHLYVLHICQEKKGKKKVFRQRTIKQLHALCFISNVYKQQFLGLI